MHKNFERKNTLSDRDAGLLEACFRVKLAVIETASNESAAERDPADAGLIEDASENEPKPV